MPRLAERCDAACHEATGKRCSCWCGGRYHGLGTLEVRWRVWRDYGDEAERLVHAGVGLADPESGPLFALERGRRLAEERERIVRTLMARLAWRRRHRR